MIKTWQAVISKRFGNIRHACEIDIQEAMQSEIDDLRAALATARAEAIEACEHEKVAADETGEESDRAYNRAIDDCIVAIRALEDEPERRGDE